MKKVGEPRYGYQGPRSKAGRRRHGRSHVKVHARDDVVLGGKSVVVEDSKDLGPAPLRPTELGELQLITLSGNGRYVVSRQH